MKISFKDIDEYSQYVRKNRELIIKAILDGIDYSIEHELTKALIFEVSFYNSSEIYEVTLDKTEWEHSLDVCMKEFLENNQSDNAIDTYLVQKKFKENENEKR